MQTDLLSVGYRCTGNYARGVLIGNVVRFAEFFLMIGVVWYGAGPVVAAAIFLVAGVVGRFVVRVDIKRLCPWLQYGFKHTHIEHARRLFRPGIASMGLSLSSVFANQGVITVIGMTLGPTAVVLFSTMRTLTRSAFQIVNMINLAILPEMSLALGAGDKSLATQIHNYSCRLCLWLNIFAIVFLLIFGKYAYEIWTNHAIPFDTRLCAILMLTMLVNAMWCTSSVVLVATNNIIQMSAYYFISNIGVILLAFIAGYFTNLYGIALSLILVEIVMIKVVVPRSLKIMNIKPLDYIISNFNIIALFTKR
jgi:O-antigen/teichoic acid export membrane protein